jgi:hypothetical protein
MGFNPHQKRKTTPFDYAVVAAALLICVALVTWAIAG